MEQPDNMQEIEAAQTALGQFLVSMMPVPWEKICFYADAVPGSASSWFAFIEKETGVICTQDFFWDRYEQYPFEKMDAYTSLLKITKRLYHAYLERFGQEKIWRIIPYSVTAQFRLILNMSSRPVILLSRVMLFTEDFSDASISMLTANTPQQNK